MKRRVVSKNDSTEEGGGAAPPMLRNSSNGTASIRKNSTSKALLSILLIIIGTLIGFITYQKQHYEQLQKEVVDKVRIEVKGAYEEKERALTNNLQSSEKDRKTMKEKIGTLESQLASSNDRMLKLKKETEEKDHNRASSEESDIMAQQIQHLRQEIQRHDKHAVLEKFGEGPHQLEFTLDFPPEEIPEGTANTFVIEMAPIDLMPHTVHFFLEQASRGLLDGCSFHRNAGHVVQGGPISNHLNSGVNVRKPFADADLSSVSFQEYHEDFPHKKYTLGYAGRPGGPDFYVSTVDNTRNHGPGGQASYAIAAEADPCFAKVVKGFDAVDRMHKMSTKPGGYMRMQHYVAIKSVKMLKGD